MNSKTSTTLWMALGLAGIVGGLLCLFLARPDPPRKRMPGEVVWVADPGAKARKRTQLIQFGIMGIGLGGLAAGIGIQISRKHRSANQSTKK